MPRFLVTYHGSEMPHEPEAIAEARDAFMDWATKRGSALVEPGDPISSFKTMDQSGTRDGGADGAFNGWSVVEADDIDAALEMLQDHPFIGRGGQLQVGQPIEFAMG